MGLFLAVYLVGLFLAVYLVGLFLAVHLVRLFLAVYLVRLFLAVYLVGPGRLSIPGGAVYLVRLFLAVYLVRLFLAVYLVALVWWGGYLVALVGAATWWGGGLVSWIRGGLVSWIRGGLVHGRHAAWRAWFPGFASARRPATAADGRRRAGHRVAGYGSSLGSGGSGGDRRARASKNYKPANRTPAAKNKTGVSFRRFRATGRGIICEKNAKVGSWILASRHKKRARVCEALNLLCRY